MIGDVLADLAAVFLGSRGLSFSGNFSSDGRAVYQTGHGAAYDLARSGRANPAGQILTLAMMLRESFDAPHSRRHWSSWRPGRCMEGRLAPMTRPPRTAGCRRGWSR